MNIPSENKNIFAAYNGEKIKPVINEPKLMYGPNCYWKPVGTLGVAWKAPVPNAYDDEDLFGYFAYNLEREMELAHVHPEHYGRHLENKTTGNIKIPKKTLVGWENVANLAEDYIEAGDEQERKEILKTFAWEKKIFAITGKEIRHGENRGKKIVYDYIV